MSRKSLAVVVTLLVLSGCEPKPGTRHVVRGELRDVPVRTEIGPEERVAVRDGIAFWSRRGAEITIVRDGSEPRLVSLEHVPARDRIGPLTALRDGETVLWDELTSDGATVVFYAANVTAPAPSVREVGRVPNAGAYLATLEPASRGDGLVATLRSSDEHRIVLFDDTTGAAPPRVIERIARPDADGDVPIVKLGTQHVFVLDPPASSLDTTPVALRAFARKGGAARVVDRRACHSLVVLDDDPIYVAVKERCPGEFPVAQRLDVRRVRLAEDRSQTVYAVHTGGLWLTWIHGSTLLVDERMPLPHLEGTAPTYTRRASLLTL